MRVRLLQHAYSELPCGAETGSAHARVPRTHHCHVALLHRCNIARCIAATCNAASCRQGLDCGVRYAVQVCDYFDHEERTTKFLAAVEAHVRAADPILSDPIRSILSDPILCDAMRCDAMRCDRILRTHIQCATLRPGRSVAPWSTTLQRRRLQVPVMAHLLNGPDLMKVSQLHRSAHARPTVAQYPLSSRAARYHCRAARHAAAAGACSGRVGDLTAAYSCRDHTCRDPHTRQHDMVSCRNTFRTAVVPTRRL
jgi:hypothetical protein